MMVDVLGHYKLLDRIGAGGLGEVYRARDTRLGRTVAIKLPADDLQSDTSRRETLLADARAAIALSHPNIAALYEIGDEGGRVFLVFEFVPGEPLERVIAGLPLNARRAVDLAAQLADALADAHAVGVVHGDLGADTVIVTPKGNAKILDFGFAPWTLGGRAAANDARTDRGDVAALGRLLFEMLTGKQPSNGQAPSALNPSLSRELDIVVSKAIGSEDYAAATLAAELRSVAAILDVRATVEGPRIAPGRRPHRSRGPWILAAALVTLAALAGVVWWLF